MRRLLCRSSASSVSIEGVLVAGRAAYLYYLIQFLDRVAGQVCGCWALADCGCCRLVHREVRRRPGAGSGDGSITRSRGSRWWQLGRRRRRCGLLLWYSCLLMHGVRREWLRPTRRRSGVGGDHYATEVCSSIVVDSRPKVMVVDGMSSHRRRGQWGLSSSRNQDQSLVVTSSRTAADTRVAVGSSRQDSA